MIRFFRNKLSGMKLKNRILICFILLVIPAFGMTTYSSYSIIYGIVNHEMADLAQVSATQTMKNLDMYLDELYRLTNMALSDGSLRSAIRASSGTNRQISESTKTIFQFLSNIFLYRTDFHSAALYTTTGKCYIQTTTTYVVDAADDSTTAYCDEMLEDSRAFFRVIGIREYVIPIGPKHTQTARVFTVMRRIADINGSTLGIIVLNTDGSSLDRILSGAAEDSSTQFFLQDEKGKVICKAVNDGSNAMKEDGSFDKNMYIVSSAKSSSTDWVISVATPRAQLFASVWNQLTPFLVLVLFCLLFTVAMYTLLTDTFTKPLLRLSRGMKQVGEGDFSVYVEPSGMDEIGDLTVRFNKMTAHINDLLNRMVEMEVQEKESEYLVLQSQINPHFLYNTLEAIRMKCVTRAEKEIAEVINSLSNLFRLSISHRERFVCLRDELEHVKCYVAIQNFRFDNKYHLSIDAAEDLLNYKTFKLMLQPLVENCVFHGLEVKPGEGHIDISVRLEEQLLVIKIQDDGVGIPEAKLQELRVFLAEPASQSDRRSLGMRTVHERIRLFFGNGSGLQVDSEEGKGTQITLRMPAFINEKEVNFHA